MSDETQKYVRFLIPGVLGYFVLYMFCRSTDKCSIGLPVSFDEIIKLTVVFIISFIYYMLPLMAWANDAHLFRINFQIKEQLISPFESEIEGANSVKWSQFKDVFYKIVDNDNTLTIRSKKIRFNGALWSSAADLRATSALGLIATITSIIFQLLGVYPIFEFTTLVQNLIIYLLMIILSIPISARLTRKHGELTGDQCDFLIRTHRDELKKGLQEIIEKDDQDRSTSK